MKNLKEKNQAGFSMVEVTIVAVVLVAVIGIVASLVSSVKTSYAEMQPRTEALNDANAALDMLTRLIRMAGNNPTNITNLQGINPGTADAGGVYRTITLRGDWRGANTSDPPDNDTNDPWENVVFSVVNGQLTKRDALDVSGAVVFLDNVQSMSFTYFDTSDAPITNPVLNHLNISRINITLVMQAPDTEPMTFTSSAYVRLR